MANRGREKPFCDSDLAGHPPRVRLDSLARIRREMAQLYAEAKHGRREVADASKLANMLALIARIIEGGELEQRLEVLERAQDGGR